MSNAPLDDVDNDLRFNDDVHIVTCKGVYIPYVTICMVIQASIDACPVDCIHWVDKEQLPALEHVMQKRMGRTNVGVMMAGQGVSNGDVFALTNRFLKEREARCGGLPAPALILLCDSLGISDGGIVDMHS